MNLVRFTLLCWLFFFPLAGLAEGGEGISGDSEYPRSRSIVNLSTNILTDMLTLPSLGVEAGFAPRWSVALNAIYAWRADWPWSENIRFSTASLEVRRWLNTNAAYTMRRGHHVGVYGAAYRYDFLFGGEGQQAHFNWGVGISYGYMVSVSKHLSLDFTVGIGMVLGKYRKYEYIDDEYQHYVWKSDNKRYFIGPTRAEVSLVWNIGGGGNGKKTSSGKGGAQ